MNCVYCKSENIVKHGKKSGKQRWKCRGCNKTFSESTIKGYPPTTYPFEFIAYVLYQRDWDLTDHNDVKFSITKRANGLFSFMDFSTKMKKISKQTSHSWIKKYGDVYKKYISSKDAIIFFANHVDKNKVNKPKKIGFKIEKKTGRVTPKEKKKTPLYISIEKLYGFEYKGEDGETYVIYPCGEHISHSDLLESLIKKLGVETVKCLVKKWSLEKLHEYNIATSFSFRK